MKIMFLISLGFLGLSVKASDSVDSFAVVKVFGEKPMPGSFWGNASGCFITLKDAFNLAKWDALQYGIETPDGANGTCSLCSAFSYNAGVFEQRGRRGEPSSALLRNFMTYCSRADNAEGRAIQIIAARLGRFMSASAITDFRLYTKWLQDNKTPNTVRNIVFYLDCYYQTKNEDYIQSLFWYLFLNVSSSQVALAELP